MIITSDHDLTVHKYTDDFLHRSYSIMMHEKSSESATHVSHCTSLPGSDVDEMKLIKARQPKSLSSNSDMNSIPAPKVWHRTAKKSVSHSSCPRLSPNTSDQLQHLGNLTPAQVTRPAATDEWSRDFLFLAELNEI